MGVGHGGDLWQMGDAQHLLSPGHLGHFLGDLLGGPAGYAGVHLVKDQAADSVVLRQHVFQGQHDAGQLAAGGDLVDGLEGLAHVGGHEELGLLQAPRLHAVLPLAGAELGLELYLGHVQLAQLVLDPGLEGLGGLFPGLAQLLAPFQSGLFRLRQVFFQAGDGVVGKLDLVQLPAAALQIVQHLGHGGAIFLFQAIDHVQAALQLVQLIGGELHLPGLIPQQLRRVVGGRTQAGQLLGQLLQTWVIADDAPQGPLRLGDEVAGPGAVLPAGQGHQALLKAVHQFAGALEQAAAGR